MVITNVSCNYNRIPPGLDEILMTQSEDLLQEKIGFDTKKLWTEFQLIVRLIYRSKNQHKASFSFKHLIEVHTFITLQLFNFYFIINYED